MLRHTFVIPALDKQRQEDLNFRTNLELIMRLCLQTNKQKLKQQKENANAHLTCLSPQVQFQYHVEKMLCPVVQDLNSRPYTLTFSKVVTSSVLLFASAKKQLIYLHADKTIDSLERHFLKFWHFV